MDKICNQLYKKLGDVGRFGTWVNTKSRIKLYELASKIPPHTYCLEIGTHWGASACLIAYALKHSDIDSKVITIDISKDPNRFAEMGRNFTILDLWDYIIPITGDSKDVVKMLDVPVSLLHIDGSHEYDDVKADILNGTSLLIDGAVVACHDVMMKSVRDAIDELLEAYTIVPGIQTTAFSRYKDGRFTEL